MTQVIIITKKRDYINKKWKKNKFTEQLQMAN